MERVNKNVLLRRPGSTVPSLLEKRRCFGHHLKKEEEGWCVS
jgi:hypothetical protein